MRPQMKYKRMETHIGAQIGSIVKNSIDARDYNIERDQSGGFWVWNEKTGLGGFIPEGNIRFVHCDLAKPE